jgi:chemotaxis signal transduction protein
MAENMLIFTLNGRERYAIAVKHTREIVKYDRLHHLPGASAQVLGLALVRDAYIPIVDTQSILFSSTPRVVGEIAIILDVGEPVGLTVQQVHQVTMLDFASQDEPSPKSRFVSAVFHHQDGIIQGINVTEMLQFFQQAPIAQVQVPQYASPQ